MFFDSFENTVYLVLFYKTGMNVILVVLLHIRQKLLPKVHRVCVCVCVSIPKTIRHGTAAASPMTRRVCILRYLDVICDAITVLACVTVFVLRV
jgi:hypothetical protein